MRELMAALAGDVHYQDKFMKAFRERRLHPSTEITVWEYAIGEPKEQIEMSAKVSVDQRLAAERELLRNLSLPQLEELARESEALVEKARAMANGSYVNAHSSASAAEASTANAADEAE